MIWLFFLPLIAACFLFFLPFISGKNLQRIAFFMSLIPLGLLLYGHTDWIGDKFSYPWFPAASINFDLEIDPVSYIFLLLTAIIIPIAVLAVNRELMQSSNLFFGLILLLESFLIAFFTARDLAVFTFFWEAMLIPLYFIINMWGGANRKNISLKFLIYMIAGSTLMVAAVLALYFAGSTFDMDALKEIAGRLPNAHLLLAVFLLAFAVKTPLFPFHAWLPDTYYVAPTAGTILLSALLSKAGIYGVIRIAMELFPAQLADWSLPLLGLAITGVLYGGFAAWGTNDFKRLIAYSSFSHVNFILAGLFIWNQEAHAGGILQAFNHGITIAALFLAAAWLAERIGSTAIGPISGLKQFLPHLCWLTLFFVLSSVALPGTNTFVGEFLILFGIFTNSPVLAMLLGLTVILSVIYMLRWMQKVYFEKPSFYKNDWIDLRWKEMLMALPLVLLILWVGIYPKTLLQPISLAVKTIEERLPS